MGWNSCLYKSDNEGFLKFGNTFIASQVMKSHDVLASEILDPLILHAGRPKTTHACAE